MATDDIEADARALRALYVFHRNRWKTARLGVDARDGAGPVPAWDGGVDRNGRRHSSVWPKMATAARAAGTIDYVFMEAQFAAGDRPVPEPNMLHGPAGIARAVEYVATAPREARIRLRSLAETTRAAAARNRTLYGLDPAAALRAAVGDPTVAAGPLFRYCLCADAGAVDLLPRFRAGALVELVGGFHAYSEGWGRFLPADLLGEAAEVIVELRESGGPP